MPYKILDPVAVTARHRQLSLLLSLSGPHGNSVSCGFWGRPVAPVCPGGVVKKVRRYLARTLDSGMARAALGMRKERPALIGFMFHSLFKDQAEIESDLVDPFQPVTVEDFRAFIRYFSGQGYAFVSPQQILDGLDADGRYIFITFDDGYANNLRALPVAREFGAPITIFAATNYILRNRSYWWDVHYRERRARAADPAEFSAERAMLKNLSYSEITDRLVSWFGEDALAPQGEVDRPMTAEELKQAASDPLVTIGNHTTDHAILTACDESEITRQIGDCQESLTAMLGEAPEIIAYPNGNYDDRVVRIAGQLGLRLGVTTAPHKTKLPLNGGTAMEIGRYGLSGGQGTTRDCRICQSDFQLIYSCRRAQA